MEHDFDFLEVLIIHVFQAHSQVLGSLAPADDISDDVAIQSSNVQKDFVDGFHHLHIKSDISAANELV